MSNKCDWVNCDASVAGRLPLGWARLFIDEPDLDEEGCWQGTSYVLCPRHLAELREHLRTEPTIRRELPDGAKIQFVGGEPPPQPCIWKDCARKSSRYGGSITILADDNRHLHDTSGVLVWGENDLCAIHKIAAFGDGTLSNFHFSKVPPGGRPRRGTLSAEAQAALGLAKRKPHALDRLPFTKLV